MMLMMKECNQPITYINLLHNEIYEFCTYNLAAPIF